MVTCRNPGLTGQQVLRKRLRVLSLVGMLITTVDLEFVEHLAAQLVLGQHPTHGLVQDPFGSPLEYLCGGRQLTAARVTGVTLVGFPEHLLGELRVRLVSHALAAEPNPMSIQHDDIIAGIDVRRVIGTVFAHQHGGDLSRQSANDVASGINDKPVVSDRLVASHCRTSRTDWYRGHGIALDQRSVGKVE